MSLWNAFTGPNAAYLLEQYERYRANPASVEASLRAFFEANPPPEEITSRSGAAPQRDAASSSALPSTELLEKAAAALDLAQSIRWYGHWAAQLDPLGALPPGDPSLRVESYGLTEDDLRSLPASLVGGPAGEAHQTALEAIHDLRQVYSGRIGHDYLQIRNPQERAWLREAAESRRYAASRQPVDLPELLDRLTQVETFEHFLQRAFPGKTRFSIEGLDMLVPLLDVVVGCAAESGIYNILIGMAHRGRLNVLAHILNKPMGQMLAEFKDPLRRRVLLDEPSGWAGDVKYHAGGERTIDPDNDPSTINLTVRMAPNPSHLEAVNPVVEGMARAAGTRADAPGSSTFDPAVTLPVVIHGDAAFPGQGVVAETLNLYRLRGYTTGGTIHVIANNQLGFTTDPGESRSTLYASDLAKGYRIPIIHVNADDPEGVIEAARIAFAYRQHFHRDFLIDLIGYRRLGHNEGDEPAFTQPGLYAKIQAHPSARTQLARQLERAQAVPPGEAQRRYDAAMDRLQQALETLDPDLLEEPIPPVPPPGAAGKTQTAIPLERLLRLNDHLQRIPEGFTVHPRLVRVRQRREKMLPASDAAAAEAPVWPTVDWSTAEELAFGSILEDGIPIRLTGQDVERGTFSHRHAVLHDARSGETFTPLQALPSARAAFDVFNSPLSEYAALGYEFGFNVQAGRYLVIWEAQYGDFINNAQAVVDEFMVSARDKWGQLPSLVLLLPHGYEGQGPDHSSGRLERFLNLAADGNLRVANCTTAANYFHLLRRQAALLQTDPLPLVVMTPKSLLRHPLVLSPARAFVEGGWQAVIDRQPAPPRGADEPPAPQPPAETVRRLILCSGKVYVDLVTSEAAAQRPEVAVARVEQLAPFPSAEVRTLAARYRHLEEIRWVQEEPENMGAWEWVRPYLAEIAAGLPVRLTARPRAASPAEGSNNLHIYNQRRLVEQAFEAGTAGGGTTETAQRMEQQTAG
jgi:2-oxoglutarate dehydrogenase E1 component